MNRLDRIIKSERKEQYKYLKKLFKARDMASKHMKEKTRVSEVKGWYSKNEANFMFTSTLAKSIIDTRKLWNRPPPPPPRNAKPSIKKLNPEPPKPNWE